MSARLANAHMGLGDLYLEAGAPTQAAEQYRTALTMRPRFHDIRNKLAQALLQLGELDAAGHELEPVLQGNPRFLAARLNLGLVHFRRGDSGVGQPGMGSVSRPAAGQSAGPGLPRDARTQDGPAVARLSCAKRSTRHDAKSGSASTRCSELPLCAALPAGCRSGETALQRGDRFWADSNYTAALAEYRLAERSAEKDPATIVRVAHAYVMTGQLERGREQYQKLIDISRKCADQAVFDYLWVASLAAARSDRFGLARAVESALELRPGIDVGEWAPALARYYAGAGDADKALEYFERALSVGSEASAPRLLLEVAALYERQGDCLEATGYLRSYLNRVPFGDSANEARFRIGSCAFEMGRRARDQAKHDVALEHFAAVIENGSPANLIDQAWFERGEALVALGRPNEALEAYRRVVELTRGRDTQTSIRARRRILEILTGALSR